MSMTPKEIEAAREQIYCYLKVYHETSRASLDALCEAAKAAQPEDLVGRRVRILVDDIEPTTGKISSIENWTYVVNFGNCITGRYGRDDFELID